MPQRLEIKELLMRKIAEGNNFSGAKVWSDQSGDIESDTVLAFVKDGKMKILKSQLHDAYEDRARVFPVDPLPSFEQFVADIREACNINPHYLDLVEETDAVMTFAVDEHWVPVTLDVINEPAVQQAFKEYVNYYDNQLGTVLKHWHSQSIFYDRTNNRIRNVDLSTLWYSDLRPDRDVSFFGCHDDANLYVFSATSTTNQDQENVLARLRQMAADRNLTFQYRII